MCCSEIVCIRVCRLASHSLVVEEVVANITDTQTDRRRDWPCNARARLQGWSGLTQLVVNLIRSKTIESTERHMFINVLHQFYRWGVKQEICVTLITLLCGLISQVHQSFPKTTLTSGQLSH